MESLVAQFLGLVGFAALAAVVIDLLKRVGIVQDGTAPTWSLGINLVGFIAFVAVSLWKPNFDFLTLDAALATVATIAASIITFIVQLITANATHEALVNAESPLAKSF
jgi:hypothetical protein